MADNFQCMKTNRAPSNRKQLLPSNAKSIPTIPTASWGFLDTPIFLNIDSTTADNFLPNDGGRNRKYAYLSHTLNKISMPI